MASNLHPSGISQILVYSLLKEWGVDGFLQHTEKVCRFYKERRDLFIGYVNNHLNGVAVWNTPKAGKVYSLKNFRNVFVDQIIGS